MKENVREATLGITEEFRKMKIGEVVSFPFSRYKYTSVRVTPSSTLVNERAEGAHWSVTCDMDNKCAYVRRVS